MYGEKMDPGLRRGDEKMSFSRGDRPIGTNRRDRPSPTRHAEVARRPIRTFRPCRRPTRCGGSLKESGPPRRQPGRAILQLADRSGIWPKIAGGCHVARDTGAAIEAAGFAIERSERFAFSPGPLEPSVPHILGVARR